MAIEALPSTFTSGHVVAFCTHEGLKGARLDEFGDWNLIVDEAPTIWDQVKLTTSVSRSLMPELFALEPASVGSRLIARRQLSRRDLHLDTLAGPIATLHARALDPRNQVMTHLLDWKELEDRPRWRSWSLWSPAQLASFASVTILGAAFDRSLTYALCQSAAPELSWRPLLLDSVERTFSPRRLTIRHFALAHDASRHRFDSTAGQRALHSIASHLSRLPSSLIWSCNERERKLFSKRMTSGYLRPRQSGTNRWSHLHHAAAIYTAKPDLFERRLLSSLGVDPQIAIESREWDVLYQFIARTSVREADSTHEVTAYLYDRTQAEAVARMFESRTDLDLRIELLDLGFAHEPPGRADLSRLTKQQKSDRKKEQARMRKRAQRLREHKPGPDPSMA